jgi:hypothetical protein
MRLLPIVAVPLLMLVLSFAVPTLRNPIVLGVGALVAFLAARYLLARRGF